MHRLKLYTRFAQYIHTRLFLLYCIYIVWFSMTFFVKPFQAALCDDFDTPTAVKALLELIKTVHKYIQEKVSNNQLHVYHLLHIVVSYCTTVCLVERANCVAVACQL